MIIRIMQGDFRVSAKIMRESIYTEFNSLILKVIFGLSNECVVNLKYVLGPLNTMKLSKYYFFDGYV
jgi:spore maturation protein SpmB